MNRRVLCGTAASLAFLAIVPPAHAQGCPGCAPVRKDVSAPGEAVASPSERWIQIQPDLPRFASGQLELVRRACSRCHSPRDTGSLWKWVHRGGITPQSAIVLLRLGFSMRCG